MRIITGTARGMRIDAPAGDNTRPTAERVKEAIFSMIQFDLADTNVLDLYGGSGQLGLEAVSRGAELAHIVERSKEAFAVIQSNAHRTKLADRCRLLNMDSLEYLRSPKLTCKFDFVFLDPPYGSGLLKRSLELLSDGRLLAENAWLIAEDETDDAFDGDSSLAEKYELVKQSRYGRIFVTVLKLKK